MYEYYFRTKIRINSSSNICLNKYIHKSFKSQNLIPPPEQKNIQKPINNNNLIELDHIIIIFLVKNEMDLFSLQNYLDFMKDSKYIIYIKLDKKFEEIGKCLYTNIYYEDLDNDPKITYTNFFIKNIDLNFLQPDTIYYYDDDFTPKYNSLCIGKTFTKKIRVNIDTNQYQQFETNNIFWFLDKLFNKTLYKYVNNRDLVICTKNLTPNDQYNYIFLYPDILEKIKYFFNWYMISNSYNNIIIEEFIIYIFGYYFLKLNFNGNLYYNFYMDYENNNTNSFYMKKKFVGIRINENQNIPFQEFITKLKNKIANINTIIDVSSKFSTLILINNYVSCFSDDDYYISGTNITWNDNNIENLGISQSFSNIFIFQNINDYKSYKKYTNFLLSKNTFFSHQNTSFYFITKNITPIKKDKLENYVICLDKYKLKNIVEPIEYEKYVLDNLKIKNIIFSFIIPDQIIIDKFIKFYKKDYPICFIDIFSIRNNIKIDDDIFIINYFSSLDQIIKLNFFIYPNYFYNKIGDYIYKTYNLQNLESKSDENSFEYLTLLNSINNKDRYSYLKILQYNYKLSQKLILKKHNLLV